MKDRSSQSLQPFAAVRQGSKRVVAHTPIDLVGLTGFVVVAAALLAVIDVSSPIVRATVGFPLLFLAPGYATVSLLFPRDAPARESADGGVIGQTLHVSDVERAALAFGLSVGLVPLLGLAIAAVAGTFTTTTVVTAVSAYALVGTWAASIRRIRVPRDERYQFGLVAKLGAVRDAIVDTDSTTHTAVNVVLVVSVLLALSSVGYAFAAPQQGETYTELRLLTEDDSGDLVAADYPDAVESGESVPLTIGVENREGEEMTYTAVVQEQWLTDGEVIERTEHDRIDYRLGQGETGHSQPEITPEADSGEVRIAVLLYAGEVPEDPTTDNAYRYGYVWTEIDDDSTDEDE